MSEKPLPFVVTDRRKFNPDGQPREGVDLTPKPEPTPEPIAAAEPETNLVEMPAPAVEPPATDQPEAGSATDDPADAAAPTPEQMEQSLRAYEATADRLETAIRAANPGVDHPPALTFDSLVQSVYMQAVLQLGGGTQQGEQPQIDLLGAKQSIDMLGLLASRTAGNLSRQEETLLNSAIFELRLAFLEMTQALARSAQQRASGLAPNPADTPGRPGPSLIR